MTRLIQTELTPELAARLLANPDPSQRRVSRQQVDIYVRAIKEGRWRLIDDPLLVVGDTYASPEHPTGSLFNGAHRCHAVIGAHRAIPVWVDWDADPSTFDLIDIGRKRSAYQFVTEKQASARASAARVTLWYERRFERLLQNKNLNFDLHEILGEVARRSDAFEAMLPAAQTTYDCTTIAQSVALAAYAIAFDMGYEDEIREFVADIDSPWQLASGDPARLLVDRFRKQAHRKRRRNPSDDWNILVRALNLRLEGRHVTRFQQGEFAPRVAETEAEFNRRRNAWAKAHADRNPREQSKTAAS